MVEVGKTNKLTKVNTVYSQLSVHKLFNWWIIHAWM